MEALEESKVVIQNLVTVDYYAINVAKKSRRTVYNYIGEDRLTLINFMGRNWLDKTVLPKKQ